MSGGKREGARVLVRRGRTLWIICFPLFPASVSAVFFFWISSNCGSTLTLTRSRSDLTSLTLTSDSSRAAQMDLSADSKACWRIVTAGQGWCTDTGRGERERESTDRFVDGTRSGE